MMGMGVNDYSRGAAGFWIENGEIAFPVSEMKVAGNLKDIFPRLQLPMTSNSRPAPTPRSRVSTTSPSPGLEFRTPRPLISDFRPGPMQQATHRPLSKTKSVHRTP